MLLISIFPLVIYSIILLNTLGSTLRSVINKNYVNSMEDITREVNKFFIDLDEHFDIARTMEKSKNITSSQKAKMIFDTMLSTKMFYSMSLLNKDFKSITGLASADNDSEISGDTKLIQTAQKSSQVELGKITYTKEGNPFFDVVYPLNLTPKEYVYYR